MIIDLHLHTTCSDGTDSPVDTIVEAAEAGIELISFCDHNTTAAYQNLKLVAGELPLRIITGVEIDSTWQNRNLHILAYGISLNHIPLQQMLEENRNKLEQISIELIQKMEKDFADISYAEYCTFSRNPRHGGWKGIDYLLSKGQAGQYPICMKYYKKYRIQTPIYPSIEEICHIIHQAGGIAVLAHPWCRLTQEEEILLRELDLLRQAGLDGVECFYPDHPPQIRKLLVDFCRQNHLLITAGSDSHGEFAKHVDGVTYEIGLEHYELPEEQIPFFQKYYFH